MKNADIILQDAAITRQISLDYVEVQFGDDNKVTKTIRHSDME